MDRGVGGDDDDYDSAADSDYVPAAASDDEDGSSKRRKKATTGARKRMRKSAAGIELLEDLSDSAGSDAGHDDAEAAAAAAAPKETEEERQKRLDDLFAQELGLDAAASKKKAAAGKAAAAAKKPKKKNKVMEFRMPGVGPSKKKGAAADAADIKAQAAAAVRKTAAAAQDSGKVTIKQTYDFAGETVEIVKEVAADSKEAQAHERKMNKEQKASESSLGNLLDTIAKKKAMSTLTKSALDWEEFKDKQGISDELELHNKDGYLEKQAFLEKADVRQWESEQQAKSALGRRR